MKSVRTISGVFVSIIGLLLAVCLTVAPLTITHFKLIHVLLIIPLYVGMRIAYFLFLLGCAMIPYASDNS